MAKSIENWIKEDVNKVIDRDSNFLHREYFFRDENRLASVDMDVMMSPADGVIMYQKELKNDKEKILEVKGENYNLSELLCDSVDIKYPCKVLSIFMSCSDVHLNRTPTSGILSYYNVGAIASYNYPMLFKENELFSNTFKKKNNFEYIMNNERLINKFYVPFLNYTYYVVQIADYDVRMIIPFDPEQNSPIRQSERFSLVRWGSECTLIVPYSNKYKFSFIQEEKTHVQAGVDPLIKITELEHEVADKTFTITNGEGRKITIPARYKDEIYGMIDNQQYGELENLINQIQR